MTDCLLRYDQYTLCNALLWGNCYNHFNNVYNQEECSWKSVFHITVALIECFPIVSQIVSLAEFFIGVLYYYYFPTHEPISPPPTPSPNSPPTASFEVQPYTEKDLKNWKFYKLSRTQFACNEDLVNFNLGSNITPVLWSVIFNFLNKNDLMTMRYVSQSFNTRIVSKSASRLSWRIGELANIYPTFFSPTLKPPGSRPFEKRIALIQKLMNEIDWCDVTSEILSVVKTEISNGQGNYGYDSYYLGCNIKLISGSKEIEDSRLCHLHLCPKSTHESLFVQFLFLYAFYDITIPLTEKSVFYGEKCGLGNVHIQGTWKEVFEFLVPKQI